MVHVQHAYLGEFVKTWQILVWVILPVFPIIKVHTQPVALREDRFLFKFEQYLTITSKSIIYSCSSMQIWIDSLSWVDYYH